MEGLEVRSRGPLKIGLDRVDLFCETPASNLSEFLGQGPPTFIICTCGRLLAMKCHGFLAAVAALGFLVALGQVPAQAGWFGLGDSSKPGAAKEKKEKKLPAKDKKAASSRSKASAQSSGKKANGGSSSWLGGLFASKRAAPTKKAAGPVSSGSSQKPKQDKESSSPLASLFGKKASPQ